MFEIDGYRKIMMIILLLLSILSPVAFFIFTFRSLSIMQQQLSSANSRCDDLAERLRDEVSQNLQLKEDFEKVTREYQLASQEISKIRLEYERKCESLFR